MYLRAIVDEESKKQRVSINKLKKAAGDGGSYAEGNICDGDSNPT